MAKSKKKSALQQAKAQAKKTEENSAYLKNRAQELIEQNRARNQAAAKTTAKTGTTSTTGTTAKKQTVKATPKTSTTVHTARKTDYLGSIASSTIKSNRQRNEKITNANEKRKQAEETIRSKSSGAINNVLTRNVSTTGGKSFTNDKLKVDARGVTVSGGKQTDNNAVLKLTTKTQPGRNVRIMDLTTNRNEYKEPAYFKFLQDYQNEIKQEQNRQPEIKKEDTGKGNTGRIQPLMTRASGGASSGSGANTVPSQYRDRYSDNKQKPVTIGGYSTKSDVPYVNTGVKPAGKTQPEVRIPQATSTLYEKFLENRLKQYEPSLYDEYENASKEKRGEIAQNALDLEAYQRYINRHPNESWDTLDKERAEAEKHRNIASQYVTGKEAAHEEAWNSIGSSKIKNDKHIYTGILERPEDYNDHAEEYDRQLYDGYYGKGAFDTAMRSGNRETKYQALENLKELWRDVDNGTLKQAYEVDNGIQSNRNFDLAESKESYWNNKLADIERREKNRDAYNALIDQYATLAQRGDYIPEYDRTQPGRFGSMNEMERGVRTDDVHRIYSFLGKGNEYKYWATNNPRVSDEYGYAMLMTNGSDGSEDEIGQFMGLYNKAMQEGREPTEAKAFLEGLQQYALWDRYSEAEKIQVAEAARQAPWAASAASVVMKQANTYLDIPRHVAKLLGDQSVENPNSWWYKAANQSEQIESTIAKDLGPVVGEVYSNTMQSLSNFARAITTPGNTKLAQSVLGLGGFFLQVDQEATARYLKQYGYDTAAKLGAVDALFEVFEEFLPYETMLGSVGKNVGLSMLVNGLSEMGQEFTGATALDEVKSMITGQSDRNDRIAEIANNGYYIDQNGNRVDLSEDGDLAMKQARGRAAYEYYINAVKQGLGGFAGGSLGGLYGVTAEALGTARAGKTIKDTGNTFREKTGLQRLIEGGIGMKGTLSQKMAERMKMKQDSGKRVSNYETGKLAVTMMEETNEQYGQIVKDTVQRNIRDQLLARGMKGDAADVAADAIARTLNGKMTAKDSSIIAQNQASIEVWKSFQTNPEAAAGVAVDVMQNTKEQRSVANLIGDLTGKNVAARGVIRAEVDRSNLETKTAAEAVQNLAERRGDLLSERYAGKVQEILKDNKELQKSKTLLDDAMTLRISAMAMNPVMPETGLDDVTAKQLWDEAKAEFEEEDSKRIRALMEGQLSAKPGEGTASFYGNQYGTAEWDSAIRDDKRIGKNLRNQMKVIAEVSRRLGLNVEFIYADQQHKDEKTGEVTDETFIHGWENGQGITINVAGQSRAGLSKSMMVTVAHEMTHWLEKNSQEGYKELREFALNRLHASGMNVEQRLVNLIDNQRAVLGASSGQGLTLNGAMAEIVAQSCEELLTSNAMREALQVENPSLFKQVTNFVKEFIGRFDAAIRGIRLDDVSEEAQALHSWREDIAKIWLKAREEALTRSAEGTEDNDEPSFSTVRNTEDALKRYERQAQAKGSGVTVDRENSLVTVWGKDNVQFSTAAPNIVSYLQNMTDKRISDNNAEMKKILSDYNIRTGRGMLHEASLNQYANVLKKKDFKRLMELQADSARWEDKRKEYETIDEDDPAARYIMAWKRSDLKEMDRLLTEKFDSTPGVVGYKASRNYNEKGNSQIAKLIKEKNQTAIRIASAEMAQMVPDNAVLIPMPNHHGVVDENTDTLALAQAISELTGRPVINALGGVERMSRKEAKEKGKKLKAADMGFRQTAEIPAGTIPYFIDNVVGSGETAKAAHDAFGRGITLAYAKSSRAAIDGLKNANVMDSVTGSRMMSFVRPLDERGDLNRTGMPGTKYSVAQMDKEYADAVKRGDMDAAQQMVYQYANEALTDSKARYDDGELIPLYHGTKAEFNTFDTSVSGGKNGIVEGYGIYLTDRKEISEKYGDRQIAAYANMKRIAQYNKTTIKKGELTNLIKAACEQEAKERAEEEGYDNWKDALPDTWISNYVYTLEYRNISDAYKAVADTILKQNDNDNGIIQEVMYGMGIRDYKTAMDFYHNMLTPITGIDGMRTEWFNYDGEVVANVLLAFDSSQVKMTDPVTYDDNGNVIPLSERFNTSKGDIRYSVANQEIKNDDGETLAEFLPGGSVTAYSLRTWQGEDIEALTRQLVDAGFKKKDVKKWIGDVNGIAAMIAADRARLDYDAVQGVRMLKNNQEYVKTLDASTLCAKRLLYQGIYNEIQHIMPDTPLLPEDLINLINLMKKRGLVTPCGICYVESRRRMLGQFASDWLKSYDGEYKPDLEDLTTTDGLEQLKKDHRETYEDFVDAMNAKGSANPKVVQLRTDYKAGEIREMTPGQIQKVKDIGGLRVQSFSDFEVVHLIDMMQAVLDMAAMDLTSQAYTKVPAFAWVFGGTGMKINLSLIGKGTGLDENGNLLFDDVEGMPFEQAMALRNAYSKNVGTILVGMNDEHIIAAMGDDRIDFIIPFHKSGWSKREMGQVIGMASYKDYTRFQNEKLIEGKKEGGKGYKTIPNKTSKITNLAPVGHEGYWNFNRDGIWNAENYLKLCKAQHRMPKFANFLIDKGDGSFRLPTEAEAAKSERMDNIRKGYWKLLIDFKMYDNDGNPSKQMPVRPDFNMEKAQEILDNYEGGANELPKNHAIAAEFVEDYQERHPKVRINQSAWAAATGVPIMETTAEEQQEEYYGKKQRAMYADEISLSVARPDMEVSQFMMGLNEESLPTEQERSMLRQYKNLQMARDIARMAVNERRNKLRALEAKENPTAYDRREIIKLRNLLQNDEGKLERAEEQLAKVTSDQGFAKLMYDQSEIMRKLANGRTSEEVRGTVEALTKQAEALTKNIAERQKTIDEMVRNLPTGTADKVVSKAAAEKVATILRKMYGSSANKQELVQAITEIRLKMAAKEDISDDVTELAWKIANGTKGEGSVYLSELRGKTIILGKGQMAELKATESSLKEIRKELAGTGIKIRAGKDGEAGLDSEWDELCDLIPMLDRDANEKDQLEELLRVIRSEKQSLSGANMFQGNMEEVEMDLKAMIATIGTSATSDPAALQAINEMKKLVNEMAAGVQKSSEELQAIRAELAGLVDQGRLAMKMTDAMQNDINMTIKYNNALAQQSEQARWKEEKWKLIQQLKSENTQALLVEQEKWKQKIAKDKKAREMMQDNMKLRKAINTNVTRIGKLIFNETDLRNIPEHMKGLAREMLGMIVDNDLAGRKITGVARKDLMEWQRVLGIMKDSDGGVDMDDIRLITDEEAQSAVMDALADIEDGIKYYNASTSGNIISNLQAFHNALDRIAEAVATIANVIHAEQSINIGDRKIAIADAAEEIAYDMSRSRFKGELQGRGSKAIRTAKEAVVYGNMTPVYFFRNLLNRGMMKQWGELQRGENRNGLETQKAHDFIAALSERTHYKDWADQKHKVKIGGATVEMSIENIMEMLAIWNREEISKKQNPEMSSHLEKGGAYIQQDENTDGKLRRGFDHQKPMKIRAEDIAGMRALLTDEQREYMDEIVRYLSNEMSELGNEASMKMYGIKKYKESYYFPMKVWDGVKSARSDKGISGVNENRAAHKSWSKRRINKAQNALVIGNFTQDAIGHIVEMINYNTMGPAIENFNKILNYQRTEADESGVDLSETGVKRNIRVMFQETYGKDALKYLETFLKDLNGGVTQDQRKTLRERALTMFKKNAVAGSLSVAAQQPLSYIRAAMMINPVYLAQALNPKYWKGSHAEMKKYSGVAVIKDMGRFDMNFGQSAKDYVAPEKRGSIYETISDKLTVLPELMDRMTWTRMWSAVKIEQAKKNPGMDITSDEFLQKVADRFNDVMQKTQVYDSVLVKSSNMRSNWYPMKLLTSFMAEPTLSLNVLADAVRNVKGEGGKETLAKAGATFLLSAALQAAVKGAMGSGRTPDDKKTWLENFLNKWWSAFISEINPANLIPGYSDLIEVLKEGKLSDDAMTVIGKLSSSYDKMKGMIAEGKWNEYRSWEDSVGQLAQLFTNIPAKNLMRDGRAMWNWITQEPYAKRQTSSAVLKEQAKAEFFNADNLIGLINVKLGDAGFKTTNKAYYGRMFDAMQSGNTAEADQIREYLQLAKGQNEKDINTGLRTQASEKLDPAEASQWKIDNGMMDSTSTVTNQYKKGQITREQYVDFLKQINPEISDDDIWWKFDQEDYKNEKGLDEAPDGKYYRLWDAMDANKADEIGDAIKKMTDHGMAVKSIKGEITSKYKAVYLNGNSDERRKIRDAIQKAYRKMGLTAEDANKVIDKWK